MKCVLLYFYFNFYFILFYFILFYFILCIILTVMIANRIYIFIFYINNNKSIINNQLSKY